MIKRPNKMHNARPGGGGGRTRPSGGRRSFGPPQRPHPRSGGGQLGGRDYLAEFNAFQDPSIGGVQPGPLAQGYGGFQALDTMTGTKMNNFLNQFSVGGEREQAMNALGYFNGGNPYTPQVQRGYNRTMRSNAASGQYSEPGIYQHQARQPTMMENGSLDLNSVGGYTGFTTVGEDGSGQYTPFDRNARRGRIRRRGGTTGGYIL